MMATDRSHSTGLLLAVLMGAFLNSPTLVEAKGPEEVVRLKLNLRSQVETSQGSGRYHRITQPASWEAGKTALVICDMWDKHWCQGASGRVGQMAPRMNAVLTAARKKGVLIVHCPSGTMDHYKNTPPRALARSSPEIATTIPLQSWCHLDPQHEKALPIDDSDGGCDCVPQCKTYKPWSKQIDTLEIADGDAVTDSAEAYYLMHSRGIENVIVMGVHTNMCVLGRPFSIRQLRYQGMNVALMRDLTDTMYNPRMAPYVSHFTGTDLVVEHIERHWCPTVTSADLLGGEPYRFENDKRPHVVVVMAEGEYETNQTLPAFALSHLGRDFKLSYVFADDQDRNDLPGIEVLADADLAILSIRRRVLPKEQMAVIRNFLADGKPLVALRTVSHAFELRDGDVPEGYADWQGFDKEVLGCNYVGHHPSNREDGPKTYAWVDEGAAEHPITRGLPQGEFEVPSTLYQSLPMGLRTTVLMMGRYGDVKPQEPVAWTNLRADGGRVFYTSLGHRGDFEIPAFRRLLTNGIYWAIGLSAPQATASSGEQAGG